MLHLDDTIAAIATPPGEGGVGIVRVSGPRALEIADRLFPLRGGPPSVRDSHSIHYGTVQEPESGEELDDALLLLFRGPHSYTGEDVVEFSCHGGPVTLQRVLHAAVRAGARLAEPGEFTQRAFLNGRLDLAQAEAVCDLIRARTEAAQRMALRQQGGALSKEVQQLRDDLVGVLAAVEVTIDFSEEVGDLDFPAISGRISGLRGGVERLIREGERGRLYREGLRLAIVGRPNVGKSSLLNAILREERAIVTPIAGTTRDTIEEAASIRGIPVTVVDTAGLRDTDDVVERIGVERAHAAIESADVAVLVLEAPTGFTGEDEAIAARLAGSHAVWAVNKADLVRESGLVRAVDEFAERANGTQVVAVSAVSGSGLDSLEDAVLRAAGGTAAPEAALVSNVRHLHALESARESLLEAERTALQGMPPDFISIDLRGALDALGRITGQTVTEDIIHRIFADFCVGK